MHLDQKRRLIIFFIQILYSLYFGKSNKPCNVTYNVVFEEEAKKLLLIWFYEDMKNSEAFKELWFDRLSKIYVHSSSESIKLMFIWHRLKLRQVKVPVWLHLL